MIVVAITCVIATLFFSCKNRVGTIESLENIDSIPTQTVDNMVVWQIENGIIQGKMTAPRMEKYSRGTDPYDIFPSSFRVEGYTAQGELETVITADKAVHHTGDTSVWEAYGHVVIMNLPKNERMDTDTLYWNQEEEKIYTHCFVKLVSPDFYAQGYGMESNQRASNAKILQPFDSYGYIQRDTLSNE